MKQTEIKLSKEPKSPPPNQDISGENYRKKFKKKDIVRQVWVGL